ncbi:MAG: UDP-N-acetylmuramoyl-L-alanyl-D-glutamate--2,6-diaminopimelate ligase [Clostridia bacterium]|nr:UDP-N-acetylmuramoyl-L-alanyl-D-glutamate--2,6-diaminopimelate ligase [Clostridia bacterium]
MAMLSELLTGVTVIGTNLPSTDIEIGRLCTNSLEVTEGDAFLCIRGGSHDGHDFICTAVERGAALIVCERVTPYLAGNPGVRYIQTPNTRLACSQMWNALCGCPGERMILVAVTGTNGKTSTTYFLREIFKAAGYKTGVIGTVRCMVGDRVDILSDSPESGVNAMTTPAPDKLYTELAKMADEGVEIVFMEASSHSLTQYRLDPLHFDLGIFTNLTPEHLDYHRSMEEYYQAKKRLFSLCDAALLNIDDASGRRLNRELSETGMKPVTLSALSNADYMAKNPQCGDIGGIRFELLERGGLRRISCPVPGSFTVYNTLTAASAARMFGIKPDVIASALEACPQIPGRMERMPLPEGCDFEIFIDYAHTPDALENVLRTLSALKKPDGRLVVLFGCGGDRDRSKRPVMGRIATGLADYTIITGDNSRNENPRAIIYDILHGVVEGSNYKVIERRETAIRTAIRDHRPGDLILLAGKGHEDYEIDEKGKHPFSEKAIIAEALTELLE